MRTLKGIPASPGIAIAPVFVFRTESLRYDKHKVLDPEQEWQRFQEAVEAARLQISAVFEKAKMESANQAAIFEAHLMMLDDPDFMQAIQDGILGEQINAESALMDASEGFAKLLENLEDEYLRARAADVRDVTSRILRNLLGVRETRTELTDPAIILAHDLTPSDTVMLDKSKVLGFCTAQGGATSHTAILARGLGLPAVVGVGLGLLEIGDGTKVILDGSEGDILIGADAHTETGYWQRLAKMKQNLAGAQVLAKQPAITRDGKQVEVVSNIGNVTGARAALEAGAEGVGLLRTEFLYMDRTTLPDEDEQFAAYSQILEVFGQYPVILRTLDIGGDKELSCLELSREMNPFLGLRAIRLCLARPDLFIPQLRAVLRASYGHNLKIMFPMVATTAEVRAARSILESCRTELKAEGKPVAEKIEIGIMVEIPSAAVMADHLAREVDFFSIGTNDLSQYTMAADRTNAAVADLASAFQPAVLRLVREVIQAAHRHGKWVGMCGELAGEPLAIPILLGLELDEFSMNPPAIPFAKQILRSLNVEEVREIALEVLELDSPEEIQELVRHKVPAAVV